MSKPTIITRDGTVPDVSAAPESIESEVQALKRQLATLQRAAEVKANPPLPGWADRPPTLWQIHLAEDQEAARVARFEVAQREAEERLERARILAPKAAQLRKKEAELRSAEKTIREEAAVLLCRANELAAQVHQLSAKATRLEAGDPAPTPPPKRIGSTLSERTRDFANLRKVPA